MLWLLDTFPTIVLCLQRGDSAFLLCRRAGRYCCPRGLRIFHCVYHPFFILGLPSISCRGRRILSPWCSFVFVLSGPIRHQEAHVVRAEGFEDPAPLLVSCLFQDTPEIHILWAQQGFQCFTLHLHTAASYQKLFCTNFAQVLAASSFFLEAEALSLVPSYLISLCVSVQQCARFLEKEEDCDSTNSQSEQQGETSHNSVTTDEGETGTTATSNTADASVRVTGSQSDRSSGSSTMCSQETSPQLSKSSPGLKISKALAETKHSHLLLTVTVSFSSFSSSLFLFSPFSSPFPSASAFLSSLPFSSSFSQLLQKSSSCMAFFFSHNISFFI